MPFKSILAFFLLPFFVSSATAQNIAKQAILDDLAYLNQSLRQTHYNLFAYTSEKDFEENYQQIRASVSKDSMDLKTAVDLFQKVISKANTGHAEIDFPAAAYRSYAFQGGTVFPLELAFEDDVALIRKNFSDQKALKVGSKVLAIDGVSIKEILEAIYPHLSAETTYFKNAKVELLSFPRLYWQVFGQKDFYNITLQSPDGISNYTVPAIRLVEDFEYQRTDIINSDRLLQYFGQVAYLKPGNFAGAEQPYRHFIDSVFTDISTKPIDQLILDLRNHAGGDNFYSDYLVSYFASENFKWHSKFRLKSSKILKEYTRANSDTSLAYFKSILDRPKDKTYTYTFDEYQARADSNRFQGKVYVLINRHSYSMAAVTAAMIQDYGFGTIVGEKTGDWPSLHAAQFQYTLPKTGIAVKVPKGYMIRPNGSEVPQGVMPDILIKDHLVDDKDEILGALLNY